MIATQHPASVASRAHQGERSGNRLGSFLDDASSKLKQARETEESADQSQPQGQGLPIEDFNLNGDIALHLRAAGWSLDSTTPEGQQRWKKTDAGGVSAQVTYDDSAFVMVAGAAPPFEVGRQYDRFSVLSLLAFAGDRHAAEISIMTEGYGSPRFHPNRTQLQANEIAIAKAFQRLGPQVLFHEGEKDWYLYKSETGTWRVITPSVLENLLVEFVCSTEHPQSQDLITLAMNSRVRHGIARALSGLVSEPDPFPSRPGWLHLQDCMIYITAAGVERHPFAPGYRSRHQIPLTWQADALCPRFLSELLGNITPADLFLLQRWLGSVLIGGNLAQRLLMIVGTGGCGKTTFARVVELLIGATSVAQLRASHLPGRFELGRIVDIHLLIGTDVKSDFLTQGGGEMVKQLIGGDRQDGEPKGSKELLNTTGNKAVLIYSNDRLSIPLQSDPEAWRRRLLEIEFPARAEGSKKIVNFASILIRDEGPGILAWVLAGAVAHLKEIEEHGDFVLTEAQQERIDNILEQSGSLQNWADSCLVWDADGFVLTADLQQSYRAFCDARGFTGLIGTLLQRRLSALLPNRFGALADNNLPHGDKKARGYRGIRLLATPGA